MATKRRKRLSAALVEKAKLLIVEQQVASRGLLHEKLEVSHSIATKLLERLAHDGVVVRNGRKWELRSKGKSPAAVPTRRSKRRQVGLAAHPVPRAPQPNGHSDEEKDQKLSQLASAIGGEVGAMLSSVLEELQWARGLRKAALG